MNVEKSVTKEEVHCWLRSQISQSRQIRVDLIKPETSLTEDLLPDSFEMIEIITAIETQYKIKIDFENAVDLETVDDLANLILEKTK